MVQIWTGDQKTAKLCSLTDRQQAIVETVVMRLHTREALKYLEDVSGFTISERTLRREKAKLEEMKMERMQHIALHFQERHLERIDKVELIEKLMWDNYHGEKDYHKKVDILATISKMQLTLSSFYDTTRYVLEQGWKTPIYKMPEPYVSISLENEVKKEMDEIQEQRKYEIRKKRELENQTPILAVPVPVPVVEEQPVIEVKEEPDKEPEREETMTEGDLYWQTHPRMKPRN